MYFIYVRQNGTHWWSLFEEYPSNIDRNDIVEVSERIKKHYPNIQTFVTAYKLKNDVMGDFKEDIALEAVNSALDIIDKKTGNKPKSKGPLGDKLAVRLQKVIVEQLAEYFSEITEQENDSYSKSTSKHVS